MHLGIDKENNIWFNSQKEWLISCCVEKSSPFYPEQWIARR
jgi:hypothetical protein